MEKEFDTLPISRLVFRLGLPAMFAQFFNILYSIVDRVFVGNIPQDGELALASIGICAPAVTAITAFSFMVGTGGAAVLSISLGRKDREMAQKTMNNAFAMLLVIGLALTAGLLIFQRQLLFFLGSSERMYPFARAYFTVYVTGTIASLCASGMNQFILAQGYARQGMISVILGAVTNTVLDPLFIYGFHLGITGAALATVLSQICSAIYVLRFLRRRDIPVHLGFGGYRKEMVLRILSIGIMPFLITILDNVIIIFLNTQLRLFGGDMGDTYLACAAIVQSFMVIVFCPAQGITSGCGALLGYHYGARHYEKIMQTFRYVFIFCLLYMGVLLVIAQMCPQIFVRLFTGDVQNVRLASEFVSKYTMGLLGVAVQYAFVDGLTAMGKVAYAMPLSFFRKILYIVLVFLLPRVTELKNIFYAGTISDICGSLFTLTIFLTVARPLLKKEMA